MDSKDTKGTKDKRAVVFIDGNNFYHGMRQIGLTTGADFDYEAFSRKLTDGRKWRETRYYIGRVQQAGDLTRYQHQRKFLAHLDRSARIRYFLGRLETRPTKGGVGHKLQKWLNALPHRDDVNLPPTLFDELTEIAQPAKASIWVEKAVDVMLATDMVSLAYEDQYDVAYLVSADGDFTPAVQTVRATGRQVFVASPSHGQKLANAADTFISMKKRAFFHGCWL